jgi:hypothetical protein
MNTNQQKIKELLQSLDNSNFTNMKPASKEEIEIFKTKAEAKGVKKAVIHQLCELYEIVDNYYFDVVIGFHPCSDDTIFELWEYNELWIGQRDFNTLRWANNKFCLGDAGSISYSSDNEYDTLIELIAGCIQEIREMERLGISKLEEWLKVIEFYKELIGLYNWKQEPMLVLIDRLQKYGFFSTFYPSTSHEALVLSLEANPEERYENPMVYILFQASNNNFNIQFQKRQGETIIEKNYGSDLLENDIFEIQKWF